MNLNRLIFLRLLAIMPCFFWHPAQGGLDSHPCPPTPGLEGWLEYEMNLREAQINQERQKAIKLLIDFLARHPDAQHRADVLFRLAELYWENAESELLAKMRDHDVQLESYRTGTIPERPAVPHINLSKSLRIYEELLEKHPDFSQSDVVLYLYGLGLNEQGDEKTSLAIYRTLIEKHPHSAFVPDAHMAIAEYHFNAGDYTLALAAYEEVLKKPDTFLNDLAQYKSAWCLFKLGKPTQAAQRFRIVLERSKIAKHDKKESLGPDLEKEALEDLALTFSESGGALEAFRFMKQVGGQNYSIQVLSSLGEVFLRQARYDKAEDTYRILIRQFPLEFDAPRYQRDLALTLQQGGKLEASIQAHKALAEHFGPTSPWTSKHQAHPEQIEKVRQWIDESLRFVAKALHQKAQKSNVNEDYQAAVVAYQDYLQRFGSSPQAPDMLFQLGDIHYKQKNLKQAAETYLQAAKKATVVKDKNEALLAAILAFHDWQKSSPLPTTTPVSKAQALSQAEAGFINSVELLEELDPKHPKLPEMKFESGKLLHGRGHYPKAATLLLNLAVASNALDLAQAAADLALDCYNRSQAWPLLEASARELKRLGLFQSTSFGNQLDSFITSAIFQEATQRLENHDHPGAQKHYLRLVEEFPKNDLAPKALFNAAVAMEKAGNFAQALLTYEQVAQRFPFHAADATMIIAQLAERGYDYKKAATTYRDFATRYPDDPRSPEVAIRSADLFEALADVKAASEILLWSSQRFSKHPNAAKATFRAGLALVEAKHFKRAEGVFREFLKTHPKHADAPKAMLELGKTWLGLKQPKTAQSYFQRCQEPSPPGFSRRTSIKASIVAECRFRLGEIAYKNFMAIKLLPPKSRLVRALKIKADYLKEAETFFSQTVEARDLEWASAALFKIGEMYAEFAQSIYKAPEPKNMRLKELDLYRQEIQSLAFPIEEKAIGALTLSHQTAIKHGYYSLWSEKTMVLLRLIEPDRYPPEEEQRTHYLWVDPFEKAKLWLSPLPQTSSNSAKQKP